MMLIERQIDSNNENIVNENQQRLLKSSQLSDGDDDCWVVEITQPEYSTAIISPPDGLFLKPSTLPEQVAGVFSSRKIEKDRVFGPFVGEIFPAGKAGLYASGSRFSWEIYNLENQLVGCTDGRDPRKSNWMRFVNLSPLLCNLAAFQHNSQVFYKAIRDIEGDEELLVWYSAVYNLDHALNSKEYKANKRKRTPSKRVPEKRKLGEALEKKAASDKFSCDSCPFTTNVRNLYSNHLLSHLTNKLYKCDLCAATFAYKHVLDFHRGTHPDPHHNTTAHKSSHSCNICGIAMPSLVSLNNHKRSHINKNTSTNNSTIDLSSINNVSSLSTINSNGRRDQDGLGHICEICGFQSTNSRALWKHKNRRHAEEVLKCQVCGVVCENKTALRLHAQSHTGYKLFKCDICDASFVLRSDLGLHKRRHSDLKPYKCPVCDHSFAVHGDLKAHVRRHVNEKRFKCDICELTFVHSNELRNHKRTHSGEKPYGCDVCGVSFAQRLSLQIHTRVHTGEKPYKCVTCGAAFAYHNSLYVHKRSHTGEKPYKCTVCDAAFSQGGSLKGHMRIHTGEKPFKCHLCESMFSQRVSLKTHVCVSTEFISK